MLLRILSPVHIGDGESYNRLSFLIQGNKLFFIDAETVKEVLTQPQIEELNPWLESQIKRLSRLETREREREERKLSLDTFLNQVLKDSSLTGKMISKAKYSISLEGQKPEKVFSFIKSRNKPYIPGTEVKGAFRTALLYKLVMENFYSKVEEKLKNFGKEFQHALKAVKDKDLRENLSSQEIHFVSEKEWIGLFGKRKGKEIVQKGGVKVAQVKRALAGKLQEIEQEIQADAFRPFSKDAKYDLLRLLQVGDSELRSPSESLIAAPIIPVELRRRIQEAQNYHEMLRPEQEFRLDLKLSDNEFKPNFLQKFYFSPNQKEISKDEIALFRCAYEFYSEVLKEEKNSYSKKGFNEVASFLQDDIENQNMPENPVLRLGKHQGFLSLTLGLVIKDENSELYRDVLVPAIPTKTYSSNFPKTRKLARVKGKELPLGWVKLRFEK